MGEGKEGLGIFFPPLSKTPPGDGKNGFDLEKSYRFGKKNFKLGLTKRRGFPEVLYFPPNPPNSVEINDEGYY